MSKGYLAILKTNCLNWNQTENLICLISIRYCNKCTLLKPLVWTSCSKFINEPTTSLPSFIGARLTEYLMPRSTQNYTLPLANRQLLPEILVSQQCIAFLNPSARRSRCEDVNGKKINPHLFCQNSWKMVSFSNKNLQKLRSVWCLVRVFLVFTLSGEPGCSLKQPR